MGLVDSMEVCGEDSVDCWGCFEEANMGMKSPSSSSCVLLLGSAFLVGDGSGNIGGSGRLSGAFGVEIEELELHNQPIMMDSQLICASEMLYASGRRSEYGYIGDCVRVSFRSDLINWNQGILRQPAWRNYRAPTR